MVRDKPIKYNKRAKQIVYPCRIDQEQFNRIRELISPITFPEWLRATIDKRVRRG